MSERRGTTRSTVESRVSPFAGKLIWVAGIVGGLFIAGSIAIHYRSESGLKWLLAFIGAGLIILPLWMRKLNRDKAKRDAEAEAQVRPLQSEDAWDDGP